MRYAMSCTVCHFESTADDVDDVYDQIEAHKEELGDSHFVEFELKDGDTL